MAKWSHRLAGLSLVRLARLTRSGRLTTPSGARQSGGHGRRRGESVRPGIRPRLAIGWPSISLMSPVKSIGVAPLM